MLVATTPQQLISPLRKTVITLNYTRITYIYSRCNGMELVTLLYSYYSTNGATQPHAFSNSARHTECLGEAVVGPACESQWHCA